MNVKEIIKQITDGVYRIYYKQLLNAEISKDRYYIQILDDTINYFSKIEEYEKCSDLERLKPIKLELSGLYGNINNTQHLKWN